MLLWYQEQWTVKTMAKMNQIKMENDSEKVTEMEVEEITEGRLQSDSISLTISKKGAPVLAEVIAVVE